MSGDLRERLAALADRLESVRTPPARSDPTMASEYWRGYRAARDECVACLRALLDETAEGQPECCIRYEFQNALARPVCEAHGELTGGYFKLELAAKIGDEHLTAQPAAEAAQDGPTIEGDEGLHRKYRVERLNDPDGKHRGCRYFVLDPLHDPIARDALRAYATRAGAEGYFDLRLEIHEWIDEIEAALRQAGVAR